MAYKRDMDDPRESPGLAAAVVELLRQGPRAFAGEAAWSARLAELGIGNERHVRIVTEGALLGGLVARGVSPELVVLSDGAPQFVVFVHASCWIHAERPLAKLVPHNEEHRAAIEKVRGEIWGLYHDLKKYREQPDEAGRPGLETRFDALVDRRAEDQRRDAERRRSSLPGHVCPFEDDLPQVGGGFLGLLAGPGARPGSGSPFGRLDPPARPARAVCCK